MNFLPIVPATGLVGWKFLERTQAAQMEVFRNTPTISRDTDYFMNNINSVGTVDDLMSDRQLLQVALSAFGLKDDLNNTYFIRKVLEDGYLSEKALANRLSDNRYKQLTKAFGFGDFDIPRTRLSTFGTEILEKFHARQFEVAVGHVDESMRLALHAKGALADLATENGSNDTKWLKIMGSPPLRKTFEVAFGLPTSFGQLDLNTQLETFKSSSSKYLGIQDLGQFSAQPAVDRFLNRFFLQSQILGSRTTSSGQIAITLLQTAATAIS